MFCQQSLRRHNLLGPDPCKNRHPDDEEICQLAFRIKKEVNGAGGPVVTTIGADSSFDVAWREYRVDGMDEAVSGDASYFVEWAGTFAGGKVGGVGAEVERSRPLG